MLPWQFNITSSANYPCSYGQVSIYLSEVTKKEKNRVKQRCDMEKLPIFVFRYNFEPNTYEKLCCR